MTVVTVDACAGLATRVEGAASEARRTEEFSKIQADIEAIEAQRAELLAAIERTSHARDVSVERVRSLQTEAADVLRAVTEVRRRLDDEVPYLKYHLSLMAAITHMTWDAEAAPRLKGGTTGSQTRAPLQPAPRFPACSPRPILPIFLRRAVIAPPPPGQATTFDFDPTPLSSTEVADRLWGLLAAATTGDVAPRTD